MLLHRFPGFLILCCAFAAAGAQTKAAAPATLPPVKMGLWEGTVTSQMSGFQLPPDVAAKLQAMGQQVPGAPHTITTESCLTPDEWQKDMERMNNPNGSCEITNRIFTGRKRSFDVSCKSDRGMAIDGHWDLQFIDAEHIHGTGHMKSDNVGQNGQTITMDMTIDSHRLGADCGDIKPGSPQIIDSNKQN